MDFYINFEVDKEKNTIDIKSKHIVSEINKYNYFLQFNSAQGREAFVKSVIIKNKDIQTIKFSIDIDFQIKVHFKIFELLSLIEDGNKPGCLI